MAKSQKFIDPSVLTRIDGLALRVRRIVEGMFAGLHRSPYRGFSTEFAEHREYAPGDDLRYLDWKVFGRTDKYYLKQFDDETNMTWNLALDVSASMSYQGPDAALSKLEYAQCLVASLAWLALHQRDAAGLITFDQEVLEFVGSSNQPTHLQRILIALERTSAVGKTDLQAVLTRLAQTLRRRSAVLVVSDFLCPLEGTIQGLKLLSKQSHETIALHLMDTAEAKLPFRGPTSFRNLEDRSQEVAVHAALIRRGYRKAMEDFCEQIKLQLQQMSVRYVRAFTNEPVDVVISRLIDGNPHA